MLTFHSEQTKQRRAQTELDGGLLTAPVECPERVDMVLDRVHTVGLGDVRTPRAYGLDPVYAVHDRGYVDFLGNAWERWLAAGFKGEAIPHILPGRSLRHDVVPECIKGQIAHYALAADTSISPGTFTATQASKDVALAATDHVLATGEAAFGLCRPPGHHAAFDQYGGYCFFNNAAVAAQHALDSGLRRVAILDIDFHHGNGTQAIFYQRDDVLFASIHGDPRTEFPFFSGHADETGQAAGNGCNMNYPLASGTDYARWAQALDDAGRRLVAGRPELLVVSLGVDTFQGDPISSFRLASDDFIDIGKRLRGFGLPTVFVMEGGYAVAEIGINTVNVLSGFDGY